ncbi:hypothetical protein [Micromonospora aurantiaca (nom. illeg.)]|uniref:hypothetical protein n=1 Tax=Micromonospora aurantiaca (nom. illeg.) TaxID=47850 RepID=UPI000B813107
MAKQEPPRYQRVATGPIVDAVEPQIRALLAESPDMLMTVIIKRAGGPLMPNPATRRHSSHVTSAGLSPGG